MIPRGYFIIVLYTFTLFFSDGNANDAPVDYAQYFKRIQDEIEAL